MSSDPIDFNDLPLENDLSDAEDEEDLWFLPDTDDELDVSDAPGFAPILRPSDGLPFIELESWRDAQAGLAVELADVSGELGALAQTLSTGPLGWRRRLAFREVIDLSWWSGTRLSYQKVALWVMHRVGSTDDTSRALAHAAWAMNHLATGPSPKEGLSGFLERSPRSEEDMWDGFDFGFAEAQYEVQRVMDQSFGLHPIVSAARVFHAWRSLGPQAAVDMEAAVLAARIAGERWSAAETGVVFMPIAQTTNAALEGRGDAHKRLASWLSGAEQACVAARLNLRSLVRWRENAGASVNDVPGRTISKVLDVFGDLPHVTPEMAAQELGAPQRSVRRYLATLEERGVIREITGYRRSRIWEAVL
jgi:hypothetical protein